MSVVVRPATEDDVVALNAIYNEYIVDSHVSFDTDPWPDDRRRSWFRERLADGYPVLVADDDGAVVGCAWSGPWRDKAAYRGSVETTVVLAPGASGRGIGSALLSELLDRLAHGGFHTAIAIVALPNDGSIAVHEKLGYEVVGTLEDVGFKDDRYWSTTVMQRKLG